MEIEGNARFVYEFGKFVLDPAGKTLFSEGKAIHLPAKEFDTLLLLVEHNGRALSKDEMMSAIWQDAFVEESNLAKQISRLRKILNTNGQEFIETIPKHGYRFSADLRRTLPDAPVILERRTVKRLTLSQQEEEFAPSGAGRRIVTWQRATVVAVGGILIAAAWFWFRPTGTTSTRINTIAVLPLRSLTGDENSRELGLGLSDSLITKIGGLKRVIVRPTNAVASVLPDADPIDLGKKLNVDAVLEGTVQQADGNLRVNARLLRTSTGEQLWADSFQQPSQGLFALQDSLSASIAKALAFELNKSDSEQLLHRGTQNTEAYEKYLRGRFFQSQNTKEGLDQSIGLYQQAVALDPNFAEGYAGIADANLILFNFGIDGPHETIPKARDAIETALRLNPELSNAYTSKSLIQFLIDRNWPEAEKSLQRALDLDPNNADAFLRYGYFLINVGRFDDALNKLEKARELNPLSPIVSTNIGLADLCARRYREAIEQLEKTSTENPRFPLPYWLLGAAYEADGYPEKAFDTNLKALEIEGGAALAERLRKVKDTEGVDGANQEWFDESASSMAVGKEKFGSLLVASRAATVHDREQTLIWLKRAAQEHDPTLAQIKYLSKFDFVRDDPRFQEIVKGISY